MDNFEQDVLEKLSGIGERLMRLETQVLGLPCNTNCPQSKNGNGYRKWLYQGIGIGLGLGGAGGAGAAIIKALGV